MSWLVSFVLTVALGLLGCYFRELWHGYLELERQLKEKRTVKVASTQTVAHVGDGSTVTLDVETTTQIQQWMIHHHILTAEGLKVAAAKTDPDSARIVELAPQLANETVMLDRLDRALWQSRWQSRVAAMRA